MAITRVYLPPLLRAATALHPPHIPHQNSPTSFLRSHPSNILISNPHLFSTFLYRRVRPRAAAYPNPQNLPTISNPLNLSISNHHLLSRSLHTHATALHQRKSPDNVLFAPPFGFIAIAAGIMILLCENQEKPIMFATLSHKLEFRFLGIIPHKYRNGHSVVVEGLARPNAKNVRANGPWEFYLSATEVLAQPDHVVTAMQRNYTILAVKQIYSKDNDKILAKIDRGKITKSESKRTVLELDSEFDSGITQLVSSTFDEFQDLPKLLGEGHSVFVKGFTSLSLNSFKSDEINKVRSDDTWPKIVKGKTEKLEYVFSAEAITKDDKRYLPREAVAAAFGRNIAE